MGFLDMLGSIGSSLNPFALLISGGATLLSGAMSANTSAANTEAQIAAQEAMQQRSMDYNTQAAQNQEMYTQTNMGLAENYQTQMSNTAYQRARQDMMAAGLNPMMMASGGMSASTPSVGAPAGGSASVGTPQVPSFQKEPALAKLGDAVRQAFSTAVQMKEMDKLTTETAKTDLDNERLKRMLGRGGPEAEVTKIEEEGRRASKEATRTQQQTNIDVPKEQEARWRGDMEDWIKHALWGTKVAAEGASSAKTVSDSAWDMVNPIKKFFGSSAKNEVSKEYRGLSPEGRQQVKDQLNQWLRDNPRLGGRQPGQGGSYD